MSGLSLNKILAAALRWPEVARALGPYLASDLVVTNVYSRRIGQYLDDHDTLPKHGDWEAWIESLGDQHGAGVREQLRALQGYDLSSYSPELIVENAGKAFRRSAAKAAVSRLARMDDPGQALPELAAEVERIGRLEERAGLEAVEMTPLDAITPEQVSWLWPGRIPLGTLTFLEGDPGLGKSTLILDLAARLSTGREMPDGARPDVDAPAGTVLLTAEDSLKHTVRPRLDAAEAEPSRIVALEGVRYRDGEERFPHIEDIAAVERAVAAVGARLIVVDPLAAYLPPGTDSYRDASVRQALKPLVGLADRLGVAIVAIRHLTKSERKKAIYAGGGSIGLIAAARSGLLVAEHPDDDTDEVRVLASTKANLSRKPPSLAFLLHTVGTVAMILWQDEVDYSAEQILHPPDAEERTAIAEAMDILRQELAEGERPVSEMKEAAKKLGVSWAVVQKAKQRLGVESQKVAFDPPETHWVWRLPPKADDIPDASTFEVETPRTSRDSGPKPKADRPSAFAPKGDRPSAFVNSPEIRGKLPVGGPKADSGEASIPLRKHEDRPDEPIRTLEKLARDPDLPHRFRQRISRAFPGPSEEEIRELIRDIRAWLEEGDDA